LEQSRREPATVPHRIRICGGVDQSCGSDRSTRTYAYGAVRRDDRLENDDPFDAVPPRAI
jgi:hypothetical protein